MLTTRSPKPSSAMKNRDFHKLYIINARTPTRHCASLRYEFSILTSEIWTQIHAKFYNIRIIYIYEKNTVFTPHLYTAHIEIIVIIDIASLSVRLLASGDSENS